jgi:hypothetical protein
MERSIRVNQIDERAEFNDAYELERQLASAERRYAQSRAASHKAREEWRAISLRTDVSPQAIAAAKARFDAVAARANRLRDLIEELERKLEF